jgi:hypothetical protein
MKTKYFYLLSLGIALWGCDNSANQAEDNAQSYPVDVPLELRSSLSENCSPKLDGDTVYVFNAAEEITGDLACLDVQDMDWSKNSFLTVKIQRFNADSEITKSSLQEVSKGQYLLNVEITPSITQNAAPLYFSMTVPKISKEANIGVSVSVPEGLNAGTFQLKDTQWKLAGYVDVSTGKLTEAEPKDCNDCYTLSFHTDSLGTGISVGNSVIVDLGKKPVLSLGTEAYHGNTGNVGLFLDAIQSIDFYYLDAEGLKFLYNNRKNYLLYERLHFQSSISITSVLIAEGELYGNGREGITKQNRVISTKTEWDNLKAKMNSVNKVTDHFTESEIDFTNYQVIAVFDEIKGNGGWSIDISNVTEYANSIIVDITNLKTGNLTTVITQPFHIVKIPVSKLEIIFNYLKK